MMRGGQHAVILLEAILLVLLLAPDLGALAQQPSPSPGGDGPAPNIVTKAKRVVCVTGYFPISSCSGDSGDLVGGYEPEVFKRVAAELAVTGNPEWAPGNWTWKCLPSWDMTLNEIMKQDGTLRLCDLMVGGVSATPSRTLAGVRFTHPTLSSGRRIMVHINMDRGTWSFFEPFETKLWLAIFGTSAVVGLVLVLSETRLRAIRRVPGLAVQRAAGLQWGALTVLLRMASQLSPRSTAGRLVVGVWGFMSLILANLYISSMAAILSTRVQQANIKSMADLVDQPVGIFQDDQSSFQRFALNDPRYLPWSTDQDEENMLAMLRSGAISALVLDAPWAQYTAAATCDLFVVGEMILPVNLAFAFPREVPESYLHIFDSALTYLDDTGVMAQLERQLMQPSSPCHSPQGGFGQVLSPVVQLDDVTGLWIMLAACVGAALMWNLSKALWRCVAQRCCLSLPQNQPAPLRQASVGTSSPLASSAGKPCKGGPLAESTLPESSSSSSGCDVRLDTTSLLGGCPTHDEALKNLERQLGQMDHLIRHMPFVMAAVMDTRLADLRGHLLTFMATQQSSSGGPHLNQSFHGAPPHHATALSQQAANQLARIQQGAPSPHHPSRPSILATDSTSGAKGAVAAVAAALAGGHSAVQVSASETGWTCQSAVTDQPEGAEGHQLPSGLVLAGVNQTLPTATAPASSRLSVRTTASSAAPVPSASVLGHP